MKIWVEPAVDCKGSPPWLIPGPCFLAIRSPPSPSSFLLCCDDQCLLSSEALAAANVQSASFETNSRVPHLGEARVGKVLSGRSWCKGQVERVQNVKSSGSTCVCILLAHQAPSGSQVPILPLVT